MASSALGSHQHIVRSSATELATRIARREHSAQEVVEAHIQRIEEVNPRINSMTVTRFDEARLEAQQADEALSAGNNVGPLHGVPITVKEMFAVQGTNSTIGLTHVNDAGGRADVDAPLVQRLRRAGAIILGKTNVPQLMYFHETDNPVCGRTDNPWNRQRTAGGSSGGEAAMIAAGGSPLGLGSDLGGSIRVPCHFCGLTGLKPTSGRLTQRGSFETLRGMTTISFQPGPMARRVEDLAVALDVLTQPVDDQLDHDAAPSRVEDFRGVDVSRLKIGVFADHEFFPVAPPVRRAIGKAVGTLVDTGATMEEFAPPDFETAIGAYLSIMSADGGADFRRLLRGSQVDARIRKMLFLSRIPQFIRKGLAAAVSGCGQRRWSYALRNSGPRSADGAWQLGKYRRDYTQRVAALMRDLRLDAILLPPHALPAFRHGQSIDLILSACYAFWPNLLEMPAGVVPVTRIADDEPLTRRKPGIDVVDRAARWAELDSSGLPLGVQVVAPHWREDVVLAVMQAIQRRVHFICEP